MTVDSGNMTAVKKKSSRKIIKKKATAKKQYRAAASFSTLDTISRVETASGNSLRLRSQLGLNRETFARLVPMSTRNLANIEAGRKPSPTVLRQLTELKRVVDALSEVIQKNAIGPWLEQPNDAFDGLKPIEVIERGEVDRIWQMIFYLRSGVAS